MKISILILILSIMCINLQAQINVYNKQGTKISCVAEDIDIVFEDECTVSIPKSEKPGNNSSQPADIPELAPAVAAVLSAAIPAVVNAGYKFVDSLLAKNSKQYEANYEHSQSYLAAGGRKMPDFTFERRVWQKGDESEDGETALKFFFKAAEVSELSNVMVYYIDSIEQKYTKVKIKKNDRPDYSIAISLVFIKEDGTLIYNKLISPIIVRSSKFGPTRDVSKNQKYRTDIFVLPTDAFLTKVSVQIIETNPRKISAEKVLAAWNTYKDDVKTGFTTPIVEQAVTGIKESAEENKQWKIAQSKNTKESYQAYLDKYPSGKHQTEAKEKIAAFNKNPNADKNASVGNE
jgi:hypothetical protein